MACPTLLKQVISTDKLLYLGERGRRWLRALVEDELRRWWQKIEWTPDPKELLANNKNSMENKTILGIMSGYGIPAFCGFNVYACAHIEKALEEFSRSQNIKLWKKDADTNTTSEFGFSYAHEGYHPYMCHLRIWRPSFLDIKDNPDISPNDLLLGWYQTPVNISHHAPTPQNVRIDTEAEGLCHLFETDANAIAFTDIISFWQDTLHPVKRLILILLYTASFLTLSWFAVLEVLTLFKILSFF